MQVDQQQLMASTIAEFTFALASNRCWSMLVYKFAPFSYSGILVTGDEDKEAGPKISTPSELVKATKERENRWICMHGLMAAAQSKRVDICIYLHEGRKKWTKLVRVSFSKQGAKGDPEKTIVMCLKQGHYLTIARKDVTEKMCKGFPEDFSDRAKIRGAGSVKSTKTRGAKSGKSAKTNDSWLTARKSVSTASRKTLIEEEDDWIGERKSRKNSKKGGRSNGREDEGKESSKDSKRISSCDSQSQISTKR